MTVSEYMTALTVNTASEQQTLRFDLIGTLLRLDAAGLDQLIYACERHSDGLMEADVTVQTCWDADRLDIGRVGIRPTPDRLCTNAARHPDFLRAAYKRSIRPR